MMLWKCALFPRVACLSGIVQSLGCKPGLSWVNNGRCSQIIAVRKYDNLCFVQLLCPVRWKPQETNQLQLQLSTISCWTLIGESTLEKKIVNLRKLYWIYKQPNLLMLKQTNKQTWLMKQTGKIRGQIFHGGFSSKTECSERKKNEETNISRFQLLKQTDKIWGQIFHSGFLSETECSGNRKKWRNKPT